MTADDTKGAGIAEAATFCKIGDDKRPGLVPANPNAPYQVCPDDLKQGVDEVTDTQPFEWYVRIEFDELLNPNIEDLVPIVENGVATGLLSGTLANTQPVTLTCNGVAVPYDGYYDPSGNAFTWPVGPSLFIQPSDTTTIASGTECQVTLKGNIVDKSGIKVPDTEIGPYKFQLAGLTLLSADPGQPDDTTKPDALDSAAPLVLTFNAAIDAASVTADDILITEVTDCGATPSTVTHTAVVTAEAKNPRAIDISIADAAPMKDWIPAKFYTVTFTDGSSVADRAGATGTLPAPSDLTICFQVKS
jgi:hypothetical protein